MRRMGRFVSRYAIWVIVAFIAIGGVVAFIGIEPGSESDVLKFLPKSNPDVERFYDVNEKFGALNIAIVGIQEDDIFNADFMNRLGETTRVLQNEVNGIHRVLGLTTLSDFEIVKGVEGGVQPKVLVDVEHLPQDESGWKKLKEDVFSKRHVKGHFVNKDGDATVLLCYLAPKGQVVEITDEIKKEVRKRFPNAKLYWGGNPFISAHIFKVTEQDMKSLTPWAVGLIILVTLLSFRDPVGVLLALVATVFGGTIAFASMKLMDVKVNIVLSSMPVLLFAVGSAYSIHFLVRYYNLRKDEATGAAIENTFSSVVPGILAAALTTVSGFFSFLAMDMQPMREFGLFTGIGILSCLLGAILLVPAVLAITKRKKKIKKDKSKGFLIITMERVAAFASRHRIYTIVGLSVVGMFGFYYSTQVKLAMETSSFFSEGSEPDIANKFLSREFGGSQYVQIHIKADFDDPVVLKELRRLGDKIETVKYVSSVQHVAQPFALVSEAWVNLRRIPETRPRVQTLANYVLTDPASLQLMTRKRNEALLHAKVRINDAEKLLEVVKEIRSITDSELGDSFIAVNVEPDSSVKLKEAAGKARARLVADHIIALMRRADELPEVGKERETIVKDLVEVQSDWSFVPDKEDMKAVEDKIHAHLRSGETIVPLPDPGEEGDPARMLAKAMAALGPGASEKKKDAAARKTLKGFLDEESALTLTATLDPYLVDAWKIQRSRAILKKIEETIGVDITGTGKERQQLLETALLDLEAKRVALSPKAAKAAGLSAEKDDKVKEVSMKAFLTGAPVLNQGLSRSVEMNQIKSLVVSGVLVLLVMGVIFKSLSAAVVAILPAGMTILLIFGFMGFRGLYLDVGTSMIASIALGVGIDYAIHFMVWWRRSARELAGMGNLGKGDGEEEVVKVDALMAERAARKAAGKCGTAILTNALMVAGAFTVLALGDAAPLKTFGTMTAGAMFVAAVMAFTAVPALSGTLLLKRWALSGDAAGDEGELTMQEDRANEEGDDSFTDSALTKEVDKE